MLKSETCTSVVRWILGVRWSMLDSDFDAYRNLLSEVEGTLARLRLSPENTSLEAIEYARIKVAGLKADQRRLVSALDRIHHIYTLHLEDKILGTESKA